ncbi:MAG: hypothetical protein JWL84_4493 [Rhodospirillales bacterium]|nr:hypothetical protein [Rhodospirillales bacterium]
MTHSSDAHNSLAQTRVLRPGTLIRARRDPASTKPLTYLMNAHWGEIVEHVRQIAGLLPILMSDTFYAIGDGMTMMRRSVRCRVTANRCARMKAEQDSKGACARAGADHHLRLST